jgi:adenylate cyclase
MPIAAASGLATVLVSDIRDFSRLTRTLGARRIVGLLNDYFAVIADCIDWQGGSIDKFVGDGMLAVFGLPAADDDRNDAQADRALQAAVAMLISLRRWNHGRLARGLPQVDTRIGIDTDFAVVVGIGSPERRAPTIIGGGVNLASRLERTCKLYGADVLVSGRTFARLRGRYAARFADLVSVPGESAPIALYEILDHHLFCTVPNLDALLDTYRLGIDLFHGRCYARAAAAFEHALTIRPADTLSRLYLQRCRLLQAMPPPDDWNGVCQLDSVMLKAGGIVQCSNVTCAPSALRYHVLGDDSRATTRPAELEPLSAGEI